MPSRAGTQSAANSDVDMDQQSNAADTRKRKAPASRASSAKKAAPARRRGSKAGSINNNDGGSATPVREDGTSGAQLQGERDESLDAEEDDDEDDDEDGPKANLTGRGKPGKSNRKAQNRNAQRESRQRKAEYVKALEGYVALHKIDLSSQLQGLLFAIGLLIDENMKLRATLGQISSLFADPTQGSRLPDIGIDIHKLKEAVERNDKTFLLDLGESLRERVGMHSREAQAERVVKETQGGAGGSTAGKGPLPMINMVEYAQKTDATSNEEPIFGSLTARAEKELLDKIRISGQSFEQGGLGMLTTPRSPVKESDPTLEESKEGSAANDDGTGQPATTKIEELFRVFEHTTKMDQVASKSSSAQRIQPVQTSQAAPGSSTGTPVDFNEYLHSDLLNNNSNNDILGGIDFNQFLFPNGPSPPGFQMPDFSNLGMGMSSYNSMPAPYSSNNFSNNHTGSFLQPQLQHTAPSPGFAIPSSATTPLPKQSPTDGQVNANGLSSFGSISSVSPAGYGSVHLSAFKETSKTLHKQAKQLIKFHLRSKQEDSTHELPAALEPTAAQGIMPHDHRIDGILWPAMRDRLIFGGSKIDLEVVLQSLESGEAVVVHATGDLMDPAAWEVSEAFAHAHPALMDGEVLKVCNKWRTARGEAQIAL